MTQSRQSQVSLSDTPYYRCISRCVHRAYLYLRPFYINLGVESLLPCTSYQ